MISLLLFCGLMSWNPTDVRLTRHVAYTVTTEGDEGPRIKALVSVEKTFLGEPTLEDARIFIPETFFSDVRQIRCRVNKRAVPKSAYKAHRPTPEDVFLGGPTIHELHIGRRLKKGAVVSYSYRQKFPEIEMLPWVSIPNEVGIAEVVLTFNHPEDVHVDFEVFAPGAVPPFTVTRPTPTQTQWVCRNLAKREQHPYYSFNHDLAMVFPKISRAGEPLNGYTPQSFGRWYQQQLAALPALDEAGREKARALTDEHTDPRAKLTALHDYVRTHIRYVADELGRGAVVPRPAGQVLARGYGDCKDRALLVREMAASLGLDVRLALISTEAQPDTEVLHAGFFNHVVCAWRDAGRWWFFDPTNEFAPFGLLSEATVGRRTLIVGPDGGHELRSDTQTGLPRLAVAVKAAPKDGHGSAEVVLSGGMLSRAYYALSLKGLDRENYLSRLVSGHFVYLSFDQFGEAKVVEDGVVFPCRVDTSRFFVASRNRLYVPTTPMATVTRDVFPRQKDTLPLELGERIDITLDLDIDAPGFDLVADTTDLGDAGGAFFKAHARTIDAAGKKFQYHYHMPFSAVKNEQKDGFLAFAETYLKSRNQMFRLKPVDNP